LSHSTITVPLNRLRSRGRRTSIRLSYGALAPVLRSWAVPLKKYSFSV